MLTQSEFDLILNQEKHFDTQDEILLGPHPQKWSRSIISINTHEKYILDYTRNSIKVKKYSINKRYRNTIILFRYCSDCPHTNPPGTDERYFPGAHVHIYEEGYDDKIAISIEEFNLSISDSIETVLLKVLHYFKVTNVPRIQSDLF